MAFNNLRSILSTAVIELSYVVRGVRRRSSIYMVTVFTLGLALGPAILIVRTSRAVTNQAAAYPNSQDLVVVNNPEQAQIDIFDRVALSDAIASFHSLSDFTPYHEMGVNLSDPRHERLRTALVGPHFLGIVGVQPIVGRDFLPSEYAKGHDQVVILSYRRWLELDRGSMSTLNSIIRLDGLPFTIVGVAPAYLTFPDGVDVYIPSALDLSILHNSGTITPHLIGRLASRSSVTDVREEMLSRVERRSYAQAPAMARITVLPLDRYLAQPFSESIHLLLAAVLGVLIIAAANVCFLSVLQAIHFLPDLLVRSALGASIQQLLALSGTYMACVFAGAVVCGSGLTYLLLRFAEAEQMALLAGLPLPSSSVMANVLPTLLSLPFVLLAAIGLGIFTLRIAMRPRPPHSQGFALPRKVGLTITLVAMSGACLMVEISTGVVSSLWRIRHERLGFNLDDLATASVTLDERRYRFPGVADEFATKVLNDLHDKDPSLQAAATSNSPLTEQQSATFAMASSQLGASATALSSVRLVTPAYFSVMGIPVLQGRNFAASDKPTSPQVAIVSDDLARRLWPKTSPIGLGIHQQGSPETARVVGVVPAVKDYGAGFPPAPMIYFPLSQNAWQELTFLVHSPRSPEELSPLLKASIETEESRSVAYDVKSMAARFVDSQRSLYLVSILTASLTFLSLVLVAAGTYTFSQYAADNRSLEFAIRLALGARRASVIRLLLTDITLAATGAVLLGTASAILAQKLFMRFTGQSLHLGPWGMISTIVLLLGFVYAGSAPSVFAVCKRDLASRLKNKL